MEPQSTTVLILSANPKGTMPLRLDEERREIEAGLMERSRLREQFRLVTKVAVRPRDFQRAMLDHSPQVVHFSGHGGSEKGLVIEDEMGQTKLLDADALGALFKLYADGLRCVLLNACYSAVQAKAIAQYVPYVIGMSDQIGDRAAIEFAVAFYDALGAGRDVAFAYQNACVAIRMAGIPEADIPVLHQNSDPSSTEKSETLVSLAQNNETRFLKLSKLLKSRNWKEADQETDRILSQEKSLRIENIELISCEDWLFIDKLWLTSSKNHFGFSSQLRMWLEAGENNEIFYEIVGWKKNGEWMSYKDLLFDITAPEGQLPTLWASTKALGGFRYYLFSKIKLCYENL